MGFDLNVFSSDYEESKAKFLDRFPRIKKFWPNAVLNSYHLKNIENDDYPYTIDTITAQPLSEKDEKETGTDKHCILIISGLHGAEGFTGTAVINFFIDEYIHSINATKNGLCLVHAINPWGMKHCRRTNENNVDLNRNFIADWKTLNKKCNENYPAMNNFFNPAGVVTADNDEKFYNSLSYFMSEYGPEKLRSALTLGQFEYPEGIYFGGSKHEESTIFAINLIKDLMERYERLTFLDIHTGYGLRGALGLITSSGDSKSAKDISKIINYDDVSAATGDDFYRLEGDIIDYAYKLFSDNSRRESLFGLCLEFGTWKDDIKDTVNFLKAFFNENQFYQYGSDNETISDTVRKEFLEVLYPSDDEWRKGVIKSTRKALDAILGWSVR